MNSPHIIPLHICSHSPLPESTGNCAPSPERVPHQLDPRLGDSFCLFTPSDLFQSTNRPVDLNQILSKAEDDLRALNYLENMAKEGLLPRSEQGSRVCRALIRLSSDKIARVMAHQHILTLSPEELGWTDDLNREPIKEMILVALLGNSSVTQKLQCLDPNTYYNVNLAHGHDRLSILCDLAIFYFFGNPHVEDFLNSDSALSCADDHEDFYSIINFVFPPERSNTAQPPTEEIATLLTTIQNRGGSVIFGDGSYEGFGKLYLWANFCAEHPNLSPQDLRTSFLDWWTSNVDFRAEVVREHLKKAPLPPSYALLLPIVTPHSVAVPAQSPDYSERELFCRQLYTLIQVAIHHPNLETRVKATDCLIQVQKSQIIKDLDIDTFLLATHDLWTKSGSELSKTLIRYLFWIKLPGTEDYIKRHYDPKELATISPPATERDISRLHIADALIAEAYDRPVFNHANTIQPQGITPFIL